MHILYKYISHVHISYAYMYTHTHTRTVILSHTITRARRFRAMARYETIAHVCLANSIANIVYNVYLIWSKYICTLYTQTTVRLSLGSCCWPTL